MQDCPQWNGRAFYDDVEDQRTVYQTLNVDRDVVNYTSTDTTQPNKEGWEWED